VSEWQPIKTAPKDGTPILVWDGGNISVAEWSYSFRGQDGAVTEFWKNNAKSDEYGMALSEVGLWCGLVKGAHAAENCEELSYVQTPTHWMPLPKSPEVA
jgi:hypothetical protein